MRLPTETHDSRDMTEAEYRVEAAMGAVETAYAIPLNDATKDEAWEQLAWAGAMLRMRQIMWAQRVRREEAALRPGQGAGRSSAATDDGSG